MTSKASTLTFCFDIACPHSYIAARRIYLLAWRTRADLQWRPVLLSELQKQTKSEPSVASAGAGAKAKADLSDQDLLRTAARWGLPLSFNPGTHDSFLAQRLLCTVPNSDREDVASELFRAYWAQHQNIADPSVLSRFSKRSRLSDAAGANELLANTEDALKRGACELPAVFVTNHALGMDHVLFVGHERFALIERALGGHTDLPKFRDLRSASAPPPQRKMVRFFFDIACPWSFLAFTQLKQVQALADVQFVPILLGGLFKAIGTPDVPLLAESEAKRRYGAKDLTDWAKWWGVELNGPARFPIRTVLAQRVAIAQPKAIDAMYRAAWQKHQDIGEAAVLRKVLAEAGFAADALLAKAQSAETKSQLRANTVQAAADGVFGVPSFQIDDALIFGQDRLDVVLDLCGGWKPTPVAPSQSAGPVRRWGGYAGKARGWAMVLGGSAAFDEEEVEDNGSAAAYRSEPRSLFASSASGGRAPRASRAARSAVSVPRQQAASGARGRVRLRAKL